MLIVLTNGKHYIKTSSTGKIEKTDNILEAQTFRSCNLAIRKVLKAPNKCKDYYPFDIEDARCGRGNGRKRKRYTREERKKVYNKAHGRCELCGHRLLFQDMTLDHIIPLSMGGNDNMENLQSLCLACNQFKSNILPDEFNQRITEIFLYQMEKKNKGGVRWKVICKVLHKIVK